MSEFLPLSSQFEHLAQKIIDLDEEDRYALGILLETFASTELEVPTAQIGVWDVQRERSGVVQWQVRSNLSLRERYSWHVQPLSSERSTETVRLVLLGSSAAASFGYWQDFSLSRVLEQKLNRSSSAQRFEVIDLSCVNAIWEDSLNTLRHAAQLQPDLVVFFCGNNEAKSLLRRLKAGKLRSLPSALTAVFLESMEALQQSQVLHHCLEELIESLVNRTVAEVRRLSMEAVFVIPQYNLKDWQGLERIPVDLSGELLNEWWQAVSRGEELLAQEQALEALSWFDQAISLDAGRCQRSLFCRARALTSLGATPQEQSAAYMAARDQGLGPFLRGVPQVTQGMIEVFRRRYTELGVPFVDLPALMDEIGQEAPPDRSFFIDYCHLNAEGINLVAAEVARLVLQKTAMGAQVDCPRLEALAMPIHPQPQEESLACWVAAIHNYHYGQNLEVVRYWLSRSLEIWPPVEKLCRFLSMHLCIPYREKFTVDWFRQQGLYDLIGERYFFFFAKFFYHARFDYPLVQLIDKLLDRFDELDHVQMANRTVGSLQHLQGNLYSLFFMDMRWGFVTSDRTTPRGGWERPCLDIDASEPISILDFPGDTADAAQLLLELSAPPDVHGECLVTLNDRKLLSCEVVTAWRRHCVQIPAGVLKPGINRLCFHWSHLTGQTEYDAPWQRRRYVTHYGHYPVAARIHRLKILSASDD